MSNSRRHTNIFPNSNAASEKRMKRWWNRAFRRITRIMLGKRYETLPTNIRKSTEVWDGAKDGKHYDPHPDQRTMRK